LETPRASFRLRPHTLREIDQILAKYREHNPYDRTTKTDVIERAVDELHRRLVPPGTGVPQPPAPRRTRTERTRP
jgi:FMN-dependent NADH-azoreductase